MIFLGKAIENGRLRFLSVTQVEKFLNCPRSWGFRHIDGIKEPEEDWQRVGNEVHAQLEHYLRAGEDTLGPIARAGKHLIYAPLTVEPTGLMIEHESLGQLELRGIPFYLRLDLANYRDYYLADDGVRSDLDADTVEVNDWKTIGNFDWMKVGRDLLTKTVQMPVYGQWALSTGWAGKARVERVRLSHTYFGKKQRRAVKSSCLATRAEIAERVEAVGEVVDRMVVAARATSGRDLEPNWSACRRCPYISVCPRDEEQDLVELFGPSVSARLEESRGERDMAFDPLAFLNSMKGGPSAAAAPSAPAAPASDPTAVAAAKATLAAQLPSPPKEPLPSLASAAPAPMLTGQAAQDYAAKTGMGSIPPGAGILPGIIPPDAPAPGTTGPVAQPIPPEQLATMPPPIRTAHDQVFPPAAPPAAPVVGTVVPASHPNKFGDGSQGDFISEPPRRGRGRPRKSPELTRSVEVAGGQLAVTTTAPEETAVDATPSDVLAIYVDCAVEGVETKPLEPYVQSLLDKLCEVFKVADIRVAPNHTADGSDSPLGFGKWRGTLAGFAKASPPPPGAYRISVEGSELRQAVLEGLRSKCAVYVRGVK